MLEWPEDPKNIRQVLIPKPVVMTLFGEIKNVCRCDQVKVLETKRIFWIIRAGPESSVWGPYTKKAETLETGKTDSGRGQGAKADPQRCGRRGHQKPEEAGPSPGAPRGEQPGRRDLRLLASRTGRECLL